MLEKISKEQLRQTNLILEELKIINGKLDESIKKREEFRCTLKNGIMNDQKQYMRIKHDTYTLV